MRGTEYSAGYALKSAKSRLLRPNERKAFRSGIGFVLPWNVEAQIRPRSGLVLNRGITVSNSPGTIDPDYRGEEKVILVNLSEKDQEVKYGERIAQVVFAQFRSPPLNVVTGEAPRTERGTKGFGSTGS